MVGNNLFLKKHVYGRYFVDYNGRHCVIDFVVWTKEAFKLIHT